MKDEDNTSSESIKAEDSNNQESQKSKKTPGARRRTKTGCLTCRVRRIKCDEARPTCRNCNKSRRDCQGYQPTTRTNSAVPMYTNFPQLPNFTTSSSNPATWLYHPLNQTNNFAEHISATGHTTQLYPPEFQTYPRNDWQFSDAGGMAVYGQGFVSNYPDHTQTLRSSDFMPHLLAQSTQHLSNSHYPDHDPAAVCADESKSSFRSSQPQTSPYQPQPLPAYFHSFSFSDDDEDPTDPWDIEAEDGYPWYHIGMAVQRRAAQVLSPLLQERNAFLLHHFVNFVRPCVYLYERRPIFDYHGRIRSAWGSTLPSAAISHPALGHAILGISALHLAILYGNSDAAARKHLLLSTKSIGKLLNDPHQRHRTEALACVLLLAFYEVMDADHSKWVMHLSGAASFLNSEHDWAGMTRTVYQMRARAHDNLAKANVRHNKVSWSDWVQIADIPEVLLRDEDWEIDQVTVGKLTGHKIDYLNSHVASHAIGTVPQDLNPIEADEVIVKIELFWWLTKQLIFQSLLSGDPLLVCYEQLLCCPPRGRLGTNLIGTVDHLWLILARLADFGGKDRQRKQKWNDVKGQGVPASKPPSSKSTPQPKKGRREQPSGTSIDRNSSSTDQNRSRMSQGSMKMDRGKAPKMFYGMIPPAPVPTSMMNSFHVLDAQLHKNSTPASTKVEAPNSDLDKQTADALSEHALIAEALNIWRRSLGNPFQALKPTPEDEIPTPFGPAQRFGDPVLACCWAFYHLAKIMLQRFHPNSPPAMVVSAVANAALTKDDAFAMLRIYWGILYDQKQIAGQGSINPSIVAALQELSFPLIFTAVHVEEAHQRTALIESFLDMERDAGWKSASASASACETLWVRLGQIGKAPPYERTVNYAGSQGARRSDQKPRSSAIVSHYGQASEHENRFVSHDRELIDKYAELRTYWALGMLSLDEDLKKMSLSK